MKLYVKTRGTTVDYRFLGPVPQRRWWESLSGRYLIEEKPTVAVSGDGPRWSAAMFGIPSRRRDSRRRTIRYSLMFEAGPGEFDLAVRCILLTLDDEARDDLGARLDEIYSAELVDAALETPLEADLPDIGRLLDILRKAAADLPGAALPPVPLPVSVPVPALALASPVAPPWIGSRSDAQAVDAFLAHARRLARGQRGICFTSRGISTVEQARNAVTELGGDVGILALDAQFRGVQSLQNSQPAQRPHSAAERVRRARLAATGSSRGVPTRTAVSMGVVLAVLVLIVWVLHET